MKGKDLFTNIQQARDHINRLKKEAEMLDTGFQENPQNIQEYVNEAMYSLAKNEQQISKKIKDFKHKLPSLGHKRQQSFLNNAYKKYKRSNYLNNSTKKSIDESTKADQTVSFTIENRPAKIYSFQDKHIRPEFITSEREAAPLQFSIPSIPQIGDPTKKATGSSQFRKRHFQTKKQLKYIDLNKSSTIVNPSVRVSRNSQENPQQYANSIDKYSLHEFMIINGKTADESPEFASYARVYDSIFPKIVEQIHNLEDILREAGINFAKFDGKKLAYLCLKDVIRKSDLIDCLVDNDSYRNKLIPENKYGGMMGRINAANKIISFWRMKNIQQKYKILKKNTLILQKFFKKNLLKLKLQKDIQKRNTQIISKFEQRQSQLISQWKSIKSQKRIQIHLNSVQVDEQKRLTIQNYPQRQNIQLSRIFRLKDQNLIIIYITSMQLSLQLVNYYYKMMQLAQIPSFRDRLIFMTPQVVNHHLKMFPSHLSSTKLLYYSSKTLNQLKIITADLPTIIYPGHPCNELIKICDYLNCYLFSGEPQKMKCFTTKSQTKRLLKNLCIETLPGTMEMYDYGEFLNTFSVLIIKNPQVETWVLKIDDQFGGRGIAYASLSKSNIVKSVLKKVQYNADSQTFATELSADPQNQQLTVRIRDYLKQHLHERLIMATPSLYKSYSDFMGRFIKKGGIIQAHPPCANTCLTYPSVTFSLQPDGQYKIVTTYEKIIGQPFKGVACSFPQKSLPFTQITTIMRQLSESFKIRKMFGVFTIDFIAYKKQKQFKYWVIDIDPYINDYTSSYFLFDLLMAGTFLPDKNAYLVQKRQNNENYSDKWSSYSQEKTYNTENSESIPVESRDYIFVPHFYHPNLMKVKIKDFFKQARLQQFNFDIYNKNGLCILLLDQLTSGVMGLLAVSQQNQKSISQLKSVLQFITKISAVKNVSYGKSQHLPATDAINLKDVYSLFTSLVRKSTRRGAKEKAIKQYQMNQNLQLI